MAGRDNDEDADTARRNAANIRLAVALALVAFLIYAGYIVMHL